MPSLLIHRDLIVRIHRYGFIAELKGFISAFKNGTHPPRVYKASGVEPLFAPYQDLGLHHHHLHRDGDPLLITQHIGGVIYGIALSTHEIYFHSDKMQWLKDNAEAIDWSDCPALQKKVLSYNPSESEPKSRKTDDDPSNDIPF